MDGSFFAQPSSSGIPPQPGSSSGTVRASSTSFSSSFGRPNMTTLTHAHSFSHRPSQTSDSSPPAPSTGLSTSQSQIPAKSAHRYSTGSPASPSGVTGLPLTTPGPAAWRTKAPTQVPPWYCAVPSKDREEERGPFSGVGSLNDGRGGATSPDESLYRVYGLLGEEALDVVGTSEVGKGMGAKEMKVLEDERAPSDTDEDEGPSSDTEEDASEKIILEVRAHQAETRDRSSSDGRYSLIDGNLHTPTTPPAPLPSSPPITAQIATSSSPDPRAPIYSDLSPLQPSHPPAFSTPARSTPSVTSAPLMPTSPSASSAAPGAMMPIGIHAVLSRRSAASLRSIPERRSEEADTPPFVAPPVPTMARTHSVTNVAAYAEDEVVGSAEIAAGGTRHSAGSQYATSSSATSAWTPSSVGGSRLGFSDIPGGASSTGHGGSSGVRSSVASRDSRYTFETDYDGEEWKGLKSAGLTMSWVSEGRDVTPIPASAPLPVEPVLTQPQPQLATLASLMASEPELVTEEVEDAHAVVGLGITSDRVVSSTRGSRSPSLSGVSVGFQPHHHSRMSRSPSLNGGSFVGSPSSRSPSICGHSSTVMGRTASSTSLRSPGLGGGVSGGTPKDALPTATTSTFGAARSRSSSAAGAYALIPRLGSIPASLRVAVNQGLSTAAPAPVISPKNPARRRVSSSAAAENAARSLSTERIAVAKHGERDSGMGFTDGEADGDGDIGANVRRAVSDDWDESEEGSPVVNRTGATGQKGKESGKREGRGRAVVLAEEGQGKVVDWSKSGTLEGLAVPDDTTHLLLADTRQPFILVSVLQARLSIVATNLVVLDISYGCLTSLPSCIASCTHLEELNLSGNSMSRCELPPFLAMLSSLRVLVADGCDLLHLPHTLAPLTSLRDLSLRDNNLRTLPVWLCQLHQLEMLLIDGNDFEPPWKELVEPLLRPTPPQRQSVDHVSLSPSSTHSFADSVMDPAMSAPLYHSSGDVGPLAVPPRPKTASPSVTRFMRPRSRHYSPDRPDSQFNTLSSIRRMRSAGDLHQESRQAAVSEAFPPMPTSSRPTLASLVEAEVQSVNSTIKGVPKLGPMEQAPSQERESKKGFGFLKKMSLGKLRKEPRFRAASADVVPTRLALAAVDDTLQEYSTDPAPNPRRLGDAASARSRTDSGASSLFLDQKRLAQRRSFLRLDQNGPIPLGFSPIPIALSTDEESTEVLGDGQTVANPRPTAGEISPIDPRTGLRSIMAYLQDVHDLSGGGVAPASQFRPTMSTSASRSSTISRAHSYRKFPRDSIATVGDCDQSGCPSTSSTYGSSSFMEMEIDLDNPDALPPSVPPAEPTPKISDNRERREFVINEIVSTERSYIRGLQELQEIYIQSAAAVVQGLGKERENVIPPTERKMVFNNVEAIVGFHVDVLLPDIQKAMDWLSATRTMTPSGENVDEGSLLTSTAERIAKVFIRHAAFLKLYSTYITNFDTALDRLRDWSLSGAPPTPNLSGSNSPVLGGSPSSTCRNIPLSTSQKKRLKAYLKRCRQHPKHTQLNLESYLLLPVQRLPRYKLLLESLLACTPGDRPTAPNPAVSEALSLISDITADMNERKRDSEGRHRLLYWQQRFGNRFRSPLVQPHRTMIKEGTMTLVRAVKLTLRETSAPGIAIPLRVPSLATEQPGAAMVGILCTDLLVLAKDAGDGGSAPPTVSAQLGQALRLPQQPRPGVQLPASVFGADQTLVRFVDSRVVLYLQCPSRRAASEWVTSINAQVPLMF